MVYWTCPRCGTNLDPGERCDCLHIEKAAAAGTATTTGRTTERYTDINIIAHPFGGVNKNQKGAF